MKKSIYNRKNLYLVFGIVLVFVCSLTIVYASLNTVLKIIGTAEVVASSWNIHLDNVSVSIGSVKGDAPSITSPTTATFSTKLTTPGDFYEFTIDVVNDGTIDAMIDSVTKTPTLTEAQSKYLNYIVEYQSGESISTKQLVEKGSFVRLKVRVEYRKDLIASDLPTINETLNLSFTLNYVQSDDTGNSVFNNGILKAKVKKGTGTNVGDEICIGNECFYVISSTENDVTMLAKYNLLVGEKYDEINGIVLLENPTGIQDEIAIGYFTDYSANNPAIGTKPFSSTNYWASTVSTYPAYVYNENSYLYEYVENYKAYLEGLGADVNEARLITAKELEGLGCSSSSNSCSDAPEWVYATTYWSGTAESAAYIWIVGSDGGFNLRDCIGSLRGVRPVITISKDEIIGIKSNVKPVANGSLDDIGTVVTIGSEQFYTIGMEGDNVKLLAKYNLLVGNKYDDTNGAVPLSNPTGIQDDSAVGWFYGYTVDNPIIAVNVFSNTNYWSGTVESYPSYVYNENSNMYEYVENYKMYLSSLGLNINEARLIKVTELEELGCNVSKGLCNAAPSWVYAVSYWSGSVNSSSNVWSVATSSGFYAIPFNITERGVRPVITIPKSEF